MTVKKMDQATYLSQTLWQFLEASAFTDLTLVCKDGEVAAHSPMLASPLLKIGFSCLSDDQERPECLLMPDSRSLSCPHSFSLSGVILNVSLLDPQYFCVLLMSSYCHINWQTMKVLYCMFCDIFESASSSAFSQTGRSERSPPSYLPEK